ncbi:hypothetical protein [Chromobacterium sp. IIBBL 290-4]|uniref:hypothetical protein n=1 Tax=Chromobacterium sp. IIBBL 290-4 TaxID=2953890 RepID=UPI0020B75813|nr:hypothetical protein [Chromobacterium sp. IIBBL 290-4]UTH72737.1 hypothetical protein NKT35_14450 [Chromobacterium sp. IIBBL 290-4]
MSISFHIRGQAPHLPWFLRRLEAQGLAAAREPAATRLPAGWMGIELEDCWLDLGRDGDHALAERLARCAALSLPVVELRGDWSPFAAEHGFMLLIGNPPAPDSAACRMLDALAPAPGCWLPCGPAHSARFCERVFIALQHQGLGSLRQPDGAPHALQWEAMLESQWRIADKLAELAQGYLAERVGLLPPYPSPLPEAAQHFAAALARAILLTLPDPAVRGEWLARIQTILANQGAN